MDYFAVSLPASLVFDEDLNLRNKIHCNYMMALGYAGLGDKEAASGHYRNILSCDRFHLGAIFHQSLSDNIE
eukprot:CAMPEP_0198154362 /NCGR_PEP_ID=MMETSP1443-20131203/68408_1 /TAXON_ID=186043 /ORGANISM="Entomoneis sp., Strain CCMP2396" /LENGTH=71 /DNA_ID=CAMNT_0043821025 /DNA_START=254 /DNA_END=469 /DNA_ORIENTATION=-